MQASITALEITLSVLFPGPKSLNRFFTSASYYHHDPFILSKYVSCRNHCIRLPPCSFLRLRFHILVSSACNPVFMFAHCFHHAESSSFLFPIHLHSSSFSLACAVNNCLPTVSCDGSLSHWSTSALYSCCAYMWYRAFLVSGRLCVGTHSLSSVAICCLDPAFVADLSWIHDPHCLSLSANFFIVFS